MNSTIYIVDIKTKVKTKIKTKIKVRIKSVKKCIIRIEKIKK